MKWLTLSLFFILSNNAFCGKVDSIWIHSDVMQKDIQHTIIVPNSYKKSSEKFKVLYLLHGYGGYHSNWYKRMPELESYVDTFNILIVCPDGKNSWYLDSPEDSTIRYESFITQELIPTIDEKYKTIAHKNGRMIAGLSMGGHGALYLAFRNPSLWHSCGGLSGGVDFRPFYKNWELSQLLGNFVVNKPYWDRHVVINNLPQEVDSLDIYIDCGKQDFFINVNRSLHKKLEAAQIEHTYVEYPGLHQWDYWRKAILRYLKKMQQ